MDKDQQLQKILDIAHNFRRYCKNNLMILNKEGRLIPFVLNQEQEIIVTEVVRCLRAGLPIRLILLKDRQIGVSTVIEALIYWWTATHKNQQSKIVAHDTATSMKLYNMFKRYYENSNPLFQPRAKYNTRDGMDFNTDDGLGLGSRIDTSSAENTSSGRGDTIHWLHGSEVAVWRNGEELVSGLMQAVPLLPNTAIFLESTANGVGDFFHRTWQASKRGEHAFTPLFFPWSMHLEYRLKPSPNFKLDKEERELKKQYSLDDEQLMWRREKKREFVGNPAKFYQEYPLTDAEAFLSSGSPRFDIRALLKMEEDCYDGKAYELYEGKYGDNTITPKPLTNAPLKVWEQPQDGHNYVIGADVAEGVGGDYSAATVIDKDNHKTVARWRGDVQPADFGEVLEQLGRWYNQALIGVEINNHGLTTVQRLRDIGYDQLYRKEKGVDERYEEYTSKLGWRTDVKSKPLMIDHLAEAIAKGKIIDYDRIFINECMTYVTDERGKTNAQDGCHDDTVMSTAIAFQLFEWTDVTKAKLGIKSTYPKNYMEKRKANRALIRRRVLR